MRSSASGKSLKSPGASPGSSWTRSVGQYIGLGMIFFWMMIVLNITVEPRDTMLHTTTQGASHSRESAVLPGAVPKPAMDPTAIMAPKRAPSGAKLSTASITTRTAVAKQNIKDNAEQRIPNSEGSIRETSELQWPPVLQDGSIDPRDGYDIMPLTGLKVPKFWSPAHGQKVTDLGTFVNKKETIFLMIASYRDFQCRETIASAFLRADNPERLFIGAVDQISKGDIGCLTLEVPCEKDPSQPACIYKDQISVYKMEAEMATGPVTARHIGDRLYRGQYFVMQMDAHCHFARHWDTNIIQQWRQTGNEMAVLTSYLTDFKGSLDENFDSTRKTRPIMCNSDFEGAMPARYLRHGSQPEDFPTIRDMPQLQPFWAAGFSFSRGHFTVTVPYDGYEPMVFQGEEITIGIRGFTHGYDFYAPRDSVVFHEYADNSKRRSKIHMFWENGQKHQGEAKKSLARAMSIIKMAPDIDPSSYDHTEEEKYGLGNVRSLEYFYKLFLIDPVERKATPLCPFVKSGKMHTAFQKHLRPDRMGIDYSHLENFDTRAALEDIFQGQRPAGEQMLRAAVSSRNMGQLDDAISNAQRIGIDRNNPKLFQQALAAREKLGLS